MLNFINKKFYLFGFFEFILDNNYNNLNYVYEQKFYFFNIKKNVDFVLTSPKTWGYFFQDSFSLNLDYILCLHELLISFLIIILIFVSWLLLKLIFLFFTNKNGYYKKKKNFFFFFFYFLKKIYFFFIYRIFLLFNLIFLILFFFYSIFLFFFLIKFLNFIFKFNFIKVNFSNKYRLDCSNLLILNINFFEYFIRNFFYFEKLIIFLNNKKIQSNTFFNFYILGVYFFFYYLNKKNIYNKNYNYNFISDVYLEIIWTLLPAFFLCLLVFPSFYILNLFNNSYYFNSNPTYTVRVTGHQWWWEYESFFNKFNCNYIELNYYLNNYLFYNTFSNQNINWILILMNRFNSFDFILEYKFLKKLIDESEFKNNITESYMISDEDLELGDYRLLEVDNSLILPVKKTIRLLITSDDVLHSWAIPALGCKIDACPGRLNEIFLYIKKPGIFYGQCSELCGYYHGFMPIVVEAVEYDIFYKIMYLK